VSAKLVALGKTITGKPTPLGITNVFRLLGMTSLLKACSNLLASYFGNQREYDTGISGVTKLLGWTFTLANEFQPEGVNLWVDITNEFNTMSHAAIAEGLSDMPPPLQWLQRSFFSFYSEDVPLFFTRDNVTHTIISQIGSMQGDPASGIWFNACLQRAFNQLRNTLIISTFFILHLYNF
jgi:hypothetical protein